MQTTIIVRETGYKTRQTSKAHVFVMVFPLSLDHDGDHDHATIHWKTQLILIALVRWVGIYPVDSALYTLNNCGLI